MGLSVYETLMKEASISTNKALRHAIGINETDLYCELVSRFKYFQEKNQLSDDGYFFNTVVDLQSGTALTKKQQLAAIKNLEKLGLIKCVLRDMPAKRYFKIIPDIELLNKYILQGKEIQQMLQKGTSRSDQKEQQDVTKGDTNNTNIIIPINNTKDNDNGAFNQCTSYDKELIELISLYMDHYYKKRTGKKHPVLKPEQYKEVCFRINSFMNDWGTDYNGLEDMMVKFLNSNIKTDYNINHFATEGILTNRMYEVAY